MDSTITDKSTSPKEGKRPRFQLCFAPNTAARSKAKLLGLSSPIITPKFYSHQSPTLTDDDDKEIERLAKRLASVKEIGPREKYPEPVLESHRYGWFQTKFTEPSPDIRPVHFPKRTSDMVRIQNMFEQTKVQIGNRCQ